MKRILLLLICLIVQQGYSSPPDDWGRTGHRATAQIAQNHLSKKARKQIDHILRGQSMALVSTYADEIKSDKEFRKYGPWHYVNFPFNKSYETQAGNPNGDIIVAIDTCIKNLKSDVATREQKEFYLKLLIHFIGDLHQPLHVGMAEDKGGNDFQVRWFDEGTNLHSVWDTKMIESYNMSYMELAANERVLSEGEMDGIAKGTVLDWMNDSRTLFREVYTTTRKGDKLGYSYMYAYMDKVRMQIQKGGIRLASLLNEIFG